MNVTFFGQQILGYTLILQLRLHSKHREYNSEQSVQITKAPADRMPAEYSQGQVRFS